MGWIGYLIPLLLFAALYLWFLRQYLRLKRAIRGAIIRRSKTLDELLALTPEGFEDRITQLFRDSGHKKATRMGRSGDDGVDILVQAANGEKWVVQCKQYSPKNKVSSPQIRDLAGAMLHESADRAALVTTSTFTQPARDWAKHKPIELYDGESLVAWIRKTNKR